MIRFRVGFIAVALLFGGVGVGIFLFSHAGRFIVMEDEFAHSEAAVVLSGDPVRRALAARDLYRQGRIERILVVPEPSDQVDAELIGLGLLPLNRVAERILVGSGVPLPKIVFLPDSADGTIAEAHRVRRFLEGQLPSSLVVITSKFASRRACFIVRWILYPVEIFCYPTPYDSFKPDRWWAQPRHALMVIMEYQKFLVNVFALALGLHGG